jgi:hypothetical protein
MWTLPRSRWNARCPLTGGFEDYYSPLRALRSIASTRCARDFSTWKAFRSCADDQHAGDPGAEIVAATLPRLTAGVLHPWEADVKHLHIVLITLAPATAGVLLSLAASMRRG